MYLHNLTREHCDAECTLNFLAALVRNLERIRPPGMPIAHGADRNRKSSRTGRAESVLIPWVPQAADLRKLPYRQDLHHLGGHERDPADDHDRWD